MIKQITRGHGKTIYGKHLDRIYYPEKQLYGGYVASIDQVLGDALVIQNAAVMEHALIAQSACIHSNAIITGCVQVYGNAQIGGDVILNGVFSVAGNAKIESVNDYVVVGPIGSRNAYTTFHKLISPGMYGVTCGCWTGTIADFITRVRRTYPEGHVYREQYDAAVAFARKALKIPVL